jgi:branched-chain amino acid transport system ATP-binding protein
MLRLEHIHTFYGPIEAIRGVDIEISKGEIVSLIGSNGAGKSTSLMTISGVLKPSSGKIFLNGTDITGLPPHRIVELGISQVPEGRRIFPKLTVFENLEMGHYLERGDLQSSLVWIPLFPILRKNQKGAHDGGDSRCSRSETLMSIPNPASG